MFASEGVDQHFLHRARQARMPIAQVESFTQQMQLLSAVSVADQLQILEASLRKIEDGGSTPGQLLEAWRSADGKHLERLLFAQFSRTQQARRLAVRFLDEKNGPMAQEAIVAQTRQCRTVFVVLGAAHLFGPTSVPTMLREAGLTVINH
jgi:uncharacterized protein YbaP (TraB family)